MIIHLFQQITRILKHMQCTLKCGINLNNFPSTHKYGTGRCRMHEPDIIKMYYSITAQFSTYPHSIVRVVVVH